MHKHEAVDHVNPFVATVSSKPQRSTAQRDSPRNRPTREGTLFLVDGYLQRKTGSMRWAQDAGLTQKYILEF